MGINRAPLTELILSLDRFIFDAHITIPANLLLTEDVKPLIKSSTTSSKAKREIQLSVDIHKAPQSLDNYLLHPRSTQEKSAASMYISDQYTLLRGKISELSDLTQITYNVLWEPRRTEYIVLLLRKLNIWDKHIYWIWPKGAHAPDRSLGNIEDFISVLGKLPHVELDHHMDGSAGVVPDINAFGQIRRYACDQEYIQCSSVKEATHTILEIYKHDGRQKKEE